MRTILILSVLAVACADEKSPSESTPEVNQPQANRPRVEPNYVTVDHILIGVAGNPRMPHVTRTKEEAEALVEQIQDDLASGGSWDDLKQNYSDDRQPGRGPGGPYAMANRGMNAGGATPRENMVKSFGDVAFNLEVGEIGVADYVPLPKRDCPFGYHIIKRVK